MAWKHRKTGKVPKASEDLNDSEGLEDPEDMEDPVDQESLEDQKGAPGSPRGHNLYCLNLGNNKV